MAWTTTIPDSDGFEVKLYHDGPGVPSSMATLEYVNPRTGKKEGAQGIVAWLETPGPCPRDAVPVTVKR